MTILHDAPIQTLVRIIWKAFTYIDSRTQFLWLPMGEMGGAGWGRPEREASLVDDTLCCREETSITL